MFRKTFIYILFILSATACFHEKSDKEKEEAYEQYKPEGKGGSTDILVIINPKLWSGEVGQAIKETVGSFIPGLPRRESNFKLIPIKPSDFGGLLTRHHSVLFVTSLEDKSPEGKRIKSFFTRNTLRKFERSNKFMVGKKDLFAKQQKILYLFSKNNQSIVKNLQEKQNEIIDYFKLHHLDRLKSKFMQNTYTDDKLSEFIAKKTGLDMQILNSFQTAKTDSNFLWLRQKEKVDMSITISYGTYQSQEQFEEESIVKWRNHFGFKSINDKSIKDSYMFTQDKYVPLTSRKTSINGMFAQEYRGMWKLKNNSRGGPFVGYAFVDEAENRFYYVEGFIYAPATDKKREAIFKLEAILRTISLTKEAK